MKSPNQKRKKLFKNDYILLPFDRNFFLSISFCHHNNMKNCQFCHNRKRSYHSFSRRQMFPTSLPFLSFLMLSNQDKSLVEFPSLLITEKICQNFRFFILPIPGGCLEDTQRTIYSATTLLERFEKSGLRNLVREKWFSRKKGGFIL